MLGHELRARTRVPLERGAELRLECRRDAEGLRLRLLVEPGDEDPAAGGPGLLDVLA